MNWKPAEKIAQAVLYEGYLLYPYRETALKNRKRWTFGSLEPGASAGTEVLLESDREPRIAAKLRFLEERGDGVEEREVVWEGALPSGLLECRAERAGEKLFKIWLRIENRALSTLLSCHALLAAEEGEFLSMTDPRSAGCERRGLWPVLVEPRLVLASPILLPDFPSLAPESPGDLFDGTEIDEILTLRILTLSDAEKEELGRGDARARRILERAEGLSPEELGALHGRLRGPFRTGDRVRLRPRGRADILDLALAGKEATVVSVEEDFEGRLYVAVTVDDDPGRDLGRQGQTGHRFFFRPEEVEPL